MPVEFTFWLQLAQAEEDADGSQASSAPSSSSSSKADWLDRIFAFPGVGSVAAGSTGARRAY